MNIRQEQPTDYDAVYQVVKEAFANAGHTDGDEQDLVVRLNGTVGKLNGVIEYDEAFGL